MIHYCGRWIISLSVPESWWNYIRRWFYCDCRILLLDYQVVAKTYDPRRRLIEDGSIKHNYLNFIILNIFMYISKFSHFIRNTIFSTFMKILKTIFIFSYKYPYPQPSSLLSILKKLITILPLNENISSMLLNLDYKHWGNLNIDFLLGIRQENCRYTTLHYLGISSCLFCQCDHLRLVWRYKIFTTYQYFLCYLTDRRNDLLLHYFLNIYY